MAVNAENRDARYPEREEPAQFSVYSEGPIIVLKEFSDHDKTRVTITSDVRI